MAQPSPQPMAESTDKTLKIGLQVDQQSLTRSMGDVRQAGRKLGQEFARSFEEALRTSRIGQSLLGMATRGQQQGMKVSPAAPVEGVSRVIQGATKAATDSIRTMERELQSSLARMEGLVRRLNQVGGGGGGFGGGGGSGLVDEFGRPAGGGGGGDWRSDWFGRADARRRGWDRSGQDAPGWGGGAPPALQQDVVNRRGAGGVLTPQGLMGLALRAAGGAWAINQGIQAANLPFQLSTDQARLAAAWGQPGLQMIRAQGSLQTATLLRMQRESFGNLTPQQRAETPDQRRERNRQKAIAMGTPGWAVEHVASTLDREEAQSGAGLFGGMGRAAGHPEATNRAIGMLKGLTALNPLQIAMEAAGVGPQALLAKQVPIQAMQEFQAQTMTQAWNRAHSRFDQQWGQFQAWGQGLFSSRPWQIEAALTKHGFDPGQLIAGQHAIMGTGGLGTATRHRWAAMAAQVGGVGDIGQLIGAAAQGGQDPGRLARQLAGLRLDPVAQGLVAQALAAPTLAGQAPNDIQSMMAMFATPLMPTGAGAQMRAVQGMIGGLGAANQNIFGRGMDPLQQARLAVNAVEAAPGNLFGAQFLAENFRLEDLVQARAGRGVSASMRARGIGADQVMRFGDLTLRNMFRNTPIGGSDTPMGRLVNQMLEGGFGGDIRSFVQARGLKGKELDEVLQNYGAALQTEGFASNDRDARWLANMLAAPPGQLRAGHFRNVRGAPLRAAGDVRAKGQKEEANEIDRPEFAPTVAAQDPTGRRFGEIGEGAIGKSADDVVRAFQKVAKAIEAVAIEIHGAENRIHQVGR